MDNKLNRRDFFKKSVGGASAALLGGALLGHRLEAALAGGGRRPDIAVVTGTDYLKSAMKAVDLLGGMKSFIPRNSRVAILPNVQSHHPGTFTKPEIVRAVVRMCREAGAAEINCLSWLPAKYWSAAGLDAALKEEGAVLKIVDLKDESLFKPISLPKGKALREARIMKELLSHHCFIDMPITKDHAGNKFTGTMKNLMGINSPQTNRIFHSGDKTKPDDIDHLDQCIADLNLAIRPTLCVVDATEIITTNGPFGPGEIITPRKVVAGTDRVAIDSYCATLRGLRGEDIKMIKKGYEHGLGEIDLAKVRIKEVAA